MGRKEKRMVATTSLQKKLRAAKNKAISKTIEVKAQIRKIAEFGNNQNSEFHKKMDLLIQLKSTLARAKKSEEIKKIKEEIKRWTTTHEAMISELKKLIDSFKEKYQLAEETLTKQSDSIKNIKNNVIKSLRDKNESLLLRGGKNNEISENRRLIDQLENSSFLEIYNDEKNKHLKTYPDLQFLYSVLNEKSETAEFFYKFPYYTSRFSEEISLPDLTDEMQNPLRLIRAIDHLDHLEEEIQMAEAVLLNKTAAEPHTQINTAIPLVTDKAAAVEQPQNAPEQANQAADTAAENKKPVVETAAQAGTNKKAAPSPQKEQPAEIPQVVTEFFNSEATFHDNMKKFLEFFYMIDVEKNTYTLKDEKMFLKEGALSERERNTLKGHLKYFQGLEKNPFDKKEKTLETLLEISGQEQKSEHKNQLNKMQDVCVKYTEINEFFMDLTRKKKKNSNVFKDIVQNGTVKTIQSFLIQPIQRLPRYPLLTGEIKKIDSLSEEERQKAETLYQAYTRSAAFANIVTDKDDLCYFLKENKLKESKKSPDTLKGINQQLEELVSHLSNVTIIDKDTVPLINIRINTILTTANKYLESIKDNDLDKNKFSNKEKIKSITDRIMPYYGNLKKYQPATQKLTIESEFEKIRTHFEITEKDNLIEFLRNRNIEKLLDNLLNNFSSLLIKSDENKEKDVSAISSFINEIFIKLNAYRGKTKDDDLTRLNKIKEIGVTLDKYYKKIPMTMPLEIKKAIDANVNLFKISFKIPKDEPVILTELPPIKNLQERAKNFSENIKKLQKKLSGDSTTISIDNEGKINPLGGSKIVKENFKYYDDELKTMEAEKIGIQKKIEELKKLVSENTTLSKPEKEILDREIITAERYSNEIVQVAGPGAADIKASRPEFVLNGLRKLVEEAAADELGRSRSDTIYSGVPGAATLPGITMNDINNIAEVETFIKTTWQKADEIEKAEEEKIKEAELKIESTQKEADDAIQAAVRAREEAETSAKDQPDQENIVKAAEKQELELVDAAERKANEILRAEDKNREEAIANIGKAHQASTLTIQKALQQQQPRKKETLLEDNVPPPTSPKTEIINIVNELLSSLQKATLGLDQCIEAVGSLTNAINNMTENTPLYREKLSLFVELAKTQREAAEQEAVRPPSPK